MESIFNKQKQFFNNGTTRSLNFRKKQLKTLKKALQQNENSLQEAIYKDFKKSYFDTYTTEFALIYHEIDFALKHIEEWAATKKVGTNFINFPASSYIIPEPLGVCLVISAWNYPYQLALSPAVAAIAAGNTVILKPSEIVSHTSKALAKIINENFEASFFAVIEGGVEETTNLLSLKFDKIFFTGSTQVGKIVYEKAAHNLIPVTLELGGKSPAIITASSALEMAVKRLVWGKFLNAGQTCVAPDYVLVEKTIASKFLELCKKEIENASYSIGNNNYVQIVNNKNFNRLISYLDKQHIYIGGDIDNEQRAISPTILFPVKIEAKVMQEEIFGPILPVLTFNHLDEAINIVKKYPKPLSCYLFSNSKKEQHQVLEQISFGGGAINDTIMHLGNSNLPFGGVGLSGIGSYHGEFGFKTFSHYKGVLKKQIWLELPLKYSPLTAKKLWYIKQLFKI